MPGRQWSDDQEHEEEEGDALEVAPLEGGSPGSRLLRVHDVLDACVEVVADGQTRPKQECVHLLAFRILGWALQSPYTWR